MSRIDSGFKMQKLDKGKSKEPELENTIQYIYRVIGIHVKLNNTLHSKPEQQLII